MTINGIVPQVVSVLPTAPSLSTALLEAERTGQLPAAAWPAMRDLLLGSSEQTLAAVVEPLRQLLHARQAVMIARQELDRGFAAVAAAAAHPAQLATAASTLSLLADELAARAQQLADLE